MECTYNSSNFISFLPLLPSSKTVSNITRPHTHTPIKFQRRNHHQYERKRWRSLVKNTKFIKRGSMEEFNLTTGPIECSRNMDYAVVSGEMNETVKVSNAMAKDPPTYVSAPGKIIAIGDLHGDLAKTINTLEIAGVLRQDENGWPVWCGGNATVVQLGDVMDRGDCEIGILMLLRDLGHQAEKEGGAVYMINGNHESLNICGNFRYVTRGAFYESALAAGLKGETSLNWDEQVKARLSLYSPGGLIARELAKNPTVLIVNDTVFAHGGLLPIHVNYGLKRINREMAAWMRGDILENGTNATPPYIAMGGSNSIMWNRTLSQENFNTPYDKFYACSLAKSVLKKLKAKRLIVGHTPQLAGCNCECEGQVWRVDVGMSQGVLNASPEALVVEKDVDGLTRVDILSKTIDGHEHHMLMGDRDILQEMQNNGQTPFTPVASKDDSVMDASEKEKMGQINQDKFESILKKYLKNKKRHE